MADSAVAITAGTGTSIDTRTEATNGHHRQVVVLGDPATNAGVAPVDATAGLKVDLGADNDITGTVTANLGATDNAVLDSILADTTAILADSTAILADTAAIETATEAVQAAVEGTLTVSGTVDLGATDNAVLDDIASDTEAIKTSVALLDDAVFADDADWTDNTSKHVNIGGVYQSTPHTVTDGDVSPVLMDANGRLIVAATDNGGALSIDDGGNTITVDGTVAVTNAALTELAAAIDTEVQVDVVSSALPTGAATATKQDDIIAAIEGITVPAPEGGATEAKQDTLIGHVDGIEALLTTIDGDTSNLSVVGGGTEAAAMRVTIANNSTGVLSVDDNGGALTVDGTVTADLGATDNAVLDAIAAATAAIETAVEGTLTVTGGGGGVEYTEGDTDASITGSAIMWEDGSDTLRAVSAAKPLPVDLQDTTVAVTQSGTWDEVGINDSGNSITVDATNLDIRDLTNTDVVTAELSAVDNAVLDTIDAVLDTIKVDTEAIETAVEAIQAGQLADGHNVTIDNSTGAAAVNIQDGGNTITVDGTVAVTHAALTELGSAINSDKVDVNIVSSDVATGGTSAVDDADFTDGTTPGTPGMGVYESTPSTVTDGDLGVLGITDDRQLRVKHEDTIAVTQSGTWDEVGINDSGNSITVDNAQLSVVGSGTEATAMRVTIATDSTGVLSIDDNGGAITVDGTVAVTGVATAANQTTVIGHLDGVESVLGTIDADTGGILTSVQTLDNAISGNEMQVDVVAALPAGDNNIGNIDLASAIPAGTNAIGKLLAPDIDVTAHTNYAKKYYTNAGAVTDGIVWSPAAGKRWHVVSLFIQVSAAATVTLEDDKSGGDEAVMKMELAANSGISIPFSEKYPFASGEDAADLTITTSAGNVYVTVTGYEI